MKIKQRKTKNYSVKAFWALLGYRSYFQKEKEASSLPSKQYSSIIKKSDQIMLEKKLFLNNNLSLTDLAKEVGTNRTYLSTSIKTVKKQSFCEYLNSNRVEYSKKIIKEKISKCDTGIDSSGMTAEDYAIASGFSTTRNFVRCFKKKEGITPTQYKNALLWKVRE
ncbi:MAG: AraC family transcriptional regulator [Bacteroidales bacterium]|nr:AraC family transcriptional regulator [Bacteroidales bacterium]